MRGKLLIFIMVLAFIMSSTEVYASNLSIDRVYARIDDGRWQRIERGFFDQDVYPMDKLELEVRIENNFDRREDRIRIRNIEVEMEIDGMGSRGYIYETRRVPSITAGSRETAIFRFDVPMDAYEDNYDVYLSVFGIDENDVEHTDDYSFSFDVMRFYNHLYLEEFRLSRSRVSCENTRTSVDVDIYNIGINDIDDIRVRLKNTELDIERQESDIYLDSMEYGVRRSRYQNTFSFNVPEDAEPGIYELDLLVFAGRNEKIRESVELEVLECPRTEPSDPDDDDEGIIIIDPEPTPPPVDRPPREDPAEENDTLYLVLLGLLNVLMLIGIIVLIVVANGARRRGRTRFY